MNLSINGTGYVGLVQVLALRTLATKCSVDVDEKKIESLEKATVPFYELELEELVKQNLQIKRLEFTTSLEIAVRKTDVIFLCLPTPPSEDGSADLSYVLEVSERIVELADSTKTVVSKSTVPGGTIDEIRQIMRKKARHPVELASHPEFLKEGSVLQDSLKPDRVIIGTRSSKVSALLQYLYEPFVRTCNPIPAMKERRAEMTNCAANAFLATKISFINEPANSCEEVGANIDSIRRGIESDPRIGGQFLFPGVGNGGSCFPKAVQALKRTAEEYGCRLTILQTVERVSENQKRLFAQEHERASLGQPASKPSRKNQGDHDCREKTEGGANCMSSTSNGH